MQDRAFLIRKRMYYLLHSSDKCIAFWFCFIVTLLFVIVFSRDSFVYDAADYLSHSRLFDSSGAFSFFNFTETFRGYFFPFLIYLFNLLPEACHLGSRGGARIISAFFVAFSCTIILPYLVSLYFNKKIILFHNLMLLGIVFLFWRGLVVTPLSDFYALTMILFSSSVLVFLYRNTKISISYIVLAFLSGIFLYGAYNTRTIYIFGCLFFCFMMCYYILKRKNIYFNILCIVVLIGLLCASIPQMLINKYHLGFLSPKVYTYNDNKEYDNLFIFQLYSGLEFQLYLTAHDDNGYKGGLKAIDPVGVRILSEQQGQDRSVGQYFKIILKYPVQMVCMYFRHFINGLYPGYGEQYIDNIYKFKFHYLLLHHFLLTFGFIGLFIACKSYLHKTGSIGKGIIEILPIIPALIPCILIIPGAMEQRFLFPALFIMYAFIVYGFDKNEIFAFAKYHRIAVLLTSVGTLVIFSCIWAMTFALMGVDVLPRMISVW